MSAPTRSARLANSFIKLILVASMTLAAYFVISAERTAMCSILSRLRLKGRYKPIQHLRCVRVVAADDDAVRLHEIRNGRALFEKLRVGDDDEANVLRRAGPERRRWCL